MPGPCLHRAAAVSWSTVRCCGFWEDSAISSDRTTIAAVRRGREEEQLPTALTPERDDLRQPIR